jgi:hypothetical protein
MEKALNSPTVNAAVKANADKERRKMVDAIANIDQLKKDCKSMGAMSTAKFLTAKLPMSKLLMAKMPTAKMPTAKMPTAKMITTKRPMAKLPNAPLAGLNSTYFNKKIFI